MNDWFDLLAVQRILKSLLHTIVQKHHLLYGPTLISVHDYWKNHNFDYTDLCLQSDVCATSYVV